MINSNMEKPGEKMQITLFLVFLVCFSLFLYFFNQIEKTELVSTGGRDFQKAEVVRILQDNLQEDGSRTGQQTVLLKMRSGPMKGELVEATSTNGYLFGAPCEPGMRVIVIESISGDFSIHSVYSVDREWVIWAFVLLFIAVVCLVGGKKGFQACFGLIFTFICVIYFYLPMIYRGFSPFLASVLVAVFTTLVTMYLIGGLTAKTCSAVFGTVSGVIIAGISAWLFGKAAGISGYNVSNIESLTILEGMRGIRIGELLFSGLLISALGAVMDVGMSVSSAVFEIHKQNPRLTSVGLWKAGMNVGRDMMGTMVNTLILAFAGSAVSTLLLNYAYQLPYLQIINSNNIGIEIMQGISGSMGVVLTVPVTSFAASFLAVFAEKKRENTDRINTVQTDPVPVESK